MNRVVRYAGFGGPERLKITREPAGDPRPGQVRVRRVAAGLNPVDYKIRRGDSGYPVTLPARVGRELSGVVDAVGAGVERLRVGDRVFGTVPVGALADELVEDANFFALMPEGLPHDIAGVLALAGQTAWDVLASQSLSAGDVVVVSAAAGGVGSVLSQLAVQRGVRVIGTASPGNHAWLRSRGIEPVAYGAGAERRIRALCDAPPSAAFDLHGRLAIEQFLALGIPPHRINTNAERRDPPHGVRAVGRGATNLKTLSELARLVVTGALEIPIARRYALDEVADAFRFLEGGHLRGKVVIT